MSIHDAAIAWASEVLRFEALFLGAQAAWFAARALFAAGFVAGDRIAEAARRRNFE